MSTYLDKAIVTPDIAIFWIFGTIFYQTGTSKILAENRKTSITIMLNVARLTTVATAGFYVASRMSTNYTWIIFPAIHIGVSSLAARQVYVQNSPEYSDLFQGLGFISFATINFYLGFAACAILLRNSND